MAAFDDEFREDLAADFREVLAVEFSSPATYRPLGQGAGVAVVIVVASKAPESKGIGIGGAFRSRDPDRADTGLRIQAPAAGRSAVALGNGLADDGGIVSLQEEDSFEVAAADLGRPGGGTVRLVVTGGIERPSNAGHWNAEVRP